jgi:exopolysaccharide production protein ExoQ
VPKGRLNLRTRGARDSRPSGETRAYFEATFLEFSGILGDRMAKVIALFLCVSFVLFLLRLERKQAPKVERTSWIPTVWMLLIASKPLATWFGASVDTTDGSLLDRAALSALLCLGLALLVHRKFDWRGAVRANSALAAVLVLMLVSILWSGVPFVSLKRWIRELLAVTMACLVLTEHDPREVIVSIFRRSVYILIPFSLLLVKFYPQYGVQFSRWSGERMWIGVTLQKNGLGRLCMFSFIFIIWTFVRRRHAPEVISMKYRALAEGVVLAITLWLLKGPSLKAASATAIVALCSGLAVFGLLLWVKSGKIKLGTVLLPMIAVAIMGFGLATMLLGGSTVASFTSTLGRDDTLTGRSDIWAVLVPVFRQRPLLGRGFGSFWTSRSREYYQMGEAHSGYLEVLLELGLVGMVFYGGFVVSTCRRAIREMSRDFDWGCLLICCLIMALIHNVSESSLNSFTSQLTAVLMLLGVSLTRGTSLQPSRVCERSTVHDTPALMGNGQERSSTANDAGQSGGRASTTSEMAAKVSPELRECD